MVFVYIRIKKKSGQMMTFLNIRPTKYWRCGKVERDLVYNLRFYSTGKSLTRFKDKRMAFL